MFYKKIKDLKWNTECELPFSCRAMTVQIGFSTEENESDEVEFCISAWDTKELADLFKEFCKENGFKLKDVFIYSVSVVRAAVSMEALTEMEEQESTHLRLFVDMDGTLTKFIPQDSVNALYHKGYFLNLPPQENVVEAVKIIVKEHPEIEVFVLTAFLADSGYAYMEKKAWLDAVLPQIDAAHRIFVPNGSDKKEYVRNFSNTDVLLDDHTPNLNKWAPARGIKLINDINNKNGSWKGEKVPYDMEPLQLAEKIADIVKGKEGSNANPLTNADRIRQMTLEEMAEWLPIASDLFCNSTDRCAEEIVNYGECGSNEKCAMRWLCSESVWDTKEQIKCTKSKMLSANKEFRTIKLFSGMEPENEVISTEAPYSVIAAQLTYINGCARTGIRVENPYGIIESMGYTVNVIGCNYTLDELESLNIDAEFDYYDYDPVIPQMVKYNDDEEEFRNVVFHEGVEGDHLIVRTNAPFDVIEEQVQVFVKHYREEEKSENLYVQLKNNLETQKYVVELAEELMKFEYESDELEEPYIDWSFDLLEYF